MKSGTKIAILVFFMLVWAPWITDDFAVGKVVEKFGSPEARFNHLGQDMAVKDVPTEVHWLPFLSARCVSERSGLVCDLLRYLTNQASDREKSQALEVRQLEL